jgi:hypothetical protein
MVGQMLMVLLGITSTGALTNCKGVLNNLGMNDLKITVEGYPYLVGLNLLFKKRLASTL